jgi:hypothetical protein
MANGDTVEITSTDLIVGGLILASIVGVGYLAYVGNEQAKAMPPAPASPTPPATKNLTWQPSGNTSPPPIGSNVMAVAQDTYGNLYALTGPVSASSPSGVTFTPVAVQAQAPQSAASLTLPVGYVQGMT